ncbi:hypothetical protein SH528x_002965 [Novipirellula sp. SH528]|uniref:hypothetical protein n=1 Tax=Novipirellula sp. SH528 TaxID=3454466 RepID=UPI003F9F8839
MHFVKPTFRLRTMLIAIAMIAIGLGFWTMRRDAKRLAAKHHYASMDAGYRAVRVHAPFDPSWMTQWRSTHSLPPGLRIDRDCINAAAPLWQESFGHRLLADYYLQVANRPWRMMFPEPKPSVLTFPTETDDIAIWWSQTIDPYIERNGLDHPYGYGEWTVLEHHAYIQNGAIDLQLPWGKLRAIMPVNE